MKAMFWKVIAGLLLAAACSGAFGQSTALGNVAKLRNIIDAGDPAYAGGVKCDNSTDNSAALAAATTAANAIGATLQLPYGICRFATTWVLKNNVIYQGHGRSQGSAKGTRLYYTGTSDAIQINNPINSSTGADIHIRDLSVQSVTRTAGKATIADVGSTYLNLHNVGMRGADYGLILDQSEIVTVSGCEFIIENSGTAGIWLVNGADHTGGATAFFTNRITIEKNQFNGTAGVGIASDGGVGHTIRENNFNVLATQIRLASTINALIQANESEQQTTAAIAFKATKLNGTPTIPNTEVTIDTNYFSSTAALPFITFDAASLQYLTIIGNHFNNANAGGTIVSGASNVTRWFGVNNQQVGTGADADATFVNTVHVTNTTALAWHADTLDPAIGNGTLTSSYERNNNFVTIHVFLTAGASTTYGTGQWYFTLPFTMVGTNEAHGSALMLDSSAGTFYTGVARIYSGSPTKVYISTNASAADINSASPFTWATSDQLRFSITYPITKGSN